MQIMDRWSTAQPGGPGRPFVTYYDVSTGERMELSGTTTGNWIAKTANLLVEELDGEVGTRVQIELPVHWLRIVWLLATWTVGGVVVDTRGDVRVCGPHALDIDSAARPHAKHSVASALLPFGRPFPTAPAGYLDLGVVLPGQPDSYFPYDQPAPDDPAVELGGLALTHGALETAVPPSADRLLLEPAGLDRDVRSVLAAAHGGGSIVLVSHAGGQPAPADVERIALQEQARIA